MSLLRKILFPIVPAYYLVSWWRNVFYDTDVFTSKQYDFPLICVGNLSVGGTGKTPMIEYLIRLLKDDYKLATLSRGYKRQTDGFLIAKEGLTSTDIGDEPFQFYNKFKEIIVGVDANRQNGIAKLRETVGVPDIILLDDAFQHRQVNAGLNVLLTSYNNRYSNDICLPTGNLREPRNGANRAQIIVVTKCPKNLSDSEKAKIQKELKLNVNQALFFSWIEYDESIYFESGNQSLTYLEGKAFTLVTGIADSKPLVEFLRSKNLVFEHIEFSDHHEFSSSEIENINGKGIILTTEKDYMRLSGKIDEDNLFYLPIKVQIDRSKAFNSLVTQFVETY